MIKVTPFNIRETATISGMLSRVFFLWVNSVYERLNDTLAIFRQNDKPDLQRVDSSAIWVDENDSDRTYLLFERSSGDTVKAELTTGEQPRISSGRVLLGPADSNGNLDVDNSWCLYPNPTDGKLYVQRKIAGTWTGNNVFEV